MSNKSKSLSNSNYQTDQEIRHLLNSYKKYIRLLEDEIVEIKHIAHENGWRTTRFEAGKNLRKEIKQLEKRCLT